MQEARSGSSEGLINFDSIKFNSIQFDSMAFWSELPDDILCVIGEKLHGTSDQIRFRSVCRSWRSIIPFPQPPWLMLSEDAQSPDTRGFFGLGQSPPHQQEQGRNQEEEAQKVYQFELPEAHLVRCVGSTGTWLITVDGTERICLLNPFSRRQIDLPSQRTFEYWIEYGFDPDYIDPDFVYTPEMLRDGLLFKAIVSSPPSSSDCVVMAIHHAWRRLAFARPGDASWTTLPTPETLVFTDIIFYKQQFYAIDHMGVLIVCDHLAQPPTATVLTTKKLKRNLSHVLYLVEWMEELLFVIKIMDRRAESSYKLNGFQIYMFNFTNKSWEVFKCLGDYSLFLGDNTSMAVLASDYPGLKTNCIYFTDDYGLGYRGKEIRGGTVMGVFDLEDNSVTPHYKGTSTCFYSPPLWIVPQFPQSVAMPPHTKLD